VSNRTVFIIQCNVLRKVPNESPIDTVGNLPEPASLSTLQFHCGLWFNILYISNIHAENRVICNGSFLKDIVFGHGWELQGIGE